ncbi:putative efflux system component YknX [Thalassoglobus neptunius]|uniref:Putative efflux system component YknX n=2 Tax=Thalassoglobus neptunius TaxID=1938619 RepID=A0A5C5X548_9PLAN|nr:putative efflux system component YknX [Thalassoglobus neptunius]
MSSSSRIPSNLLTTKAVSGPFLVSLSVQGNLDSQSNVTLSSQVEGSTTIISIVPEGTLAKKGDVLCVLDSSVLREKAKQQEITVTQSKASMEQALEALKIQEKQNESDIAAAELQWELAKLDLESYIEGQYPKEEKELAGAVLLAEEELLRNEESYDFTLEQVKKGYRTQDDLEAAKLAVKQAELKLQGAEEAYKVLTAYTRKRTVAELQANSKEFERELERVKLKAKSALTQYETDVEATKLTYQVEKEQYELNLEQIEACTLTAPQNGEVVYANMSSSRRSSEPVNIEEGATIRERQAIINLPDVTQMRVDCRIHESLIGAVRKGLRTRIRIDAYPDEYFNGVVATVSSVPMAGQWPNTDLREYATEIHLNDEVEKIMKLRPGLTAQVEILVDNRPKVLQVPVQCILSIASQQFAYVVKPNGSVERRSVKIGLSNQSHVEIIDGLEEDENVVMNPRSQFADEIGELEADLSKKKDEDTANEGSPLGNSEDKAGPPNRDKAGGEKPPRNNEGAGGPPGGGDPSAIIKRLDKDGDGQISQEEAPDRLKSNFSTLDKDGDGKISKEEFAAGRPGS